MELERATVEEARGKVVFLSVFRLKSNIIIVVVSAVYYHRIVVSIGKDMFFNDL